MSGKRTAPRSLHKQTSLPEKTRADDVLRDQGQTSSTPEETRPDQGRTSSTPEAHPDQGQSSSSDDTPVDSEIEDQAASLTESITSDQEQTTTLLEKTSRTASTESETEFPEHSGAGESRTSESKPSTSGSKPSTSFASQCNSPLEGAVGGRQRISSSSSDSAIRELNQYASVMDRRALHSGKLDVFQKFFNEDRLQFLTRPENRRRHRAGLRHRSNSEGYYPDTERTSENENPLRDMQIMEPAPEPALNQAGAVVGFRIPNSDTFSHSEADNLLTGFGYVSEEHSLGSAETVPIGEAYAGNFSPPRPCSDSSRGVSPGSSFPSFSSRPATSSDYYNAGISPMPGNDSPDVARRMSPESTDSESQPAARSVRRKKPSVSKPIDVPKRGDSALAGSEGSYSDEQGNDRTRSAPASLASLLAERMSKGSPDSTEQANSPARESDLDAYMSQRPMTDSEDEAALYLELSHSVESDHCLPIPDVGAEASNALLQSSDSLQPAAATEAPSFTDEVQPEPVAEGSDSEPDPVSVSSLAPDVSKNFKHPKDDDCDK